MKIQKIIKDSFPPLLIKETLDMKENLDKNSFYGKFCSVTVEHSKYLAPNSELKINIHMLYLLDRSHEYNPNNLRGLLKQFIYVERTPNHLFCEPQWNLCFARQLDQLITDKLREDQDINYPFSDQLKFEKVKIEVITP